MSLDRRRRVSDNTILNLAGSLLPIGITVFTIPAYLRILGDAKFGILAISWALLSYFSLFEMGLGRATSKYIAEYRDVADGTRARIFWASIAMNVGTGTLGGILMYLLARPLLPYFLHNDIGYKQDLLAALPWLSAAVPLATLLSVLSGALEGREEFAIINGNSLLSTAMFQIVPLAVAYTYGPQITVLIAVSVMTRFVTGIPLAVACVRRIPLSGTPILDRAWMRKLVSYGSWILVSGIVSPIMTTVDRFIIGFVSGPEAVTYYSIPSNVAGKLYVLPLSLSRALFPRFSSQDAQENLRMAVEAAVGICALMTPVVVAGVLLTEPFFVVWLGPATANRCAGVGELIMIGVLINGFTIIPYSLLQASRRVDLTAKFHVVEMIPFVVLLWLGLKVAGVNGAAVAWVIRIAADGILLFFATNLLTRMSRLLPCLALSFIALAVAWTTHGLAIRIASATALTAIAIVVGRAVSPNTWTLMLELSTRLRRRMA